MTTEPETPRITELHVRMDCNGCENKIRKTLRAIDGVSEVYIDQASHKITVVGMADPERLIKAIRKTKRVPTIFSHTDPAAEAQAQPLAAEGEAPPPPAAPPADAAPPAAEKAPENKETKPAETPAVDATVIHTDTVHDYPSGHGHHHTHNEHWTNHHMRDVRYEASPYHAIQSYSHHRPSPYIQGRYYNPDYYPDRGKADDSQITTIFSDENPNACSIA